MSTESLEDTIQFTPIISTNQLSQPIQDKLVLEPIPTTPQVSREDLEDLYERIAEHKRSVADQPTKKHKPNSILLAVYKTIDTIFDSQKTREYLRNIQDEQSLQEKQQEIDRSKETYNLLLEFRDVVQDTAVEYRNAIEQISSYINFLRHQKNVSIPQIIAMQDNTVKESKEKILAIQNALTDTSTQKFKKIAPNFYAAAEQDLEKRTKQLQEALATKDYLAHYNDSYLDNKIQQATDVHEEATKTIPYIRELDIEVSSAITEYKGLTEPSQQIGRGLQIFQTLEDLKEQLHEETNHAAQQAQHESEVYRLNQDASKRIRGKQ